MQPKKPSVGNKNVCCLTQSVIFQYECPLPQLKCRNRNMLQYLFTFTKMTLILHGSTSLLHVVFQTCLDTNTTQMKRMAEKKSSISLCSAYIEYEPFAKELRKNPCIWDLRNDYYNLPEYHGLAFRNKGTVLCLKCKCYMYLTN